MDAEGNAYEEDKDVYDIASKFDLDLESNFSPGEATISSDDSSIETEPSKLPIEIRKTNTTMFVDSGSVCTIVNEN